MKLILIIGLVYILFISNGLSFDFNNTTYINGLHDCKIIIDKFNEAKESGNIIEYNILVDKWNSDLNKTNNKTLIKEFSRIKIKEKSNKKYRVIIEEI